MEICDPSTWNYGVWKTFVGILAFSRIDYRLNDSFITQDINGVLEEVR